MCCCRHFSGGNHMSRVQLALNVADLDASIEFYTKLFQTEPAEDPRRVRQLRDRRPAPETGPVHRPGRARIVEPHRRRGRRRRRRAGDDRSRQRPRARTERSRRTCRVASQFRTRHGSRVRRTTGRSTSSRVTHRRCRAEPTTSHPAVQRATTWCSKPCRATRRLAAERRVAFHARAVASWLRRRHSPTCRRRLPRECLRRRALVLGPWTRLPSVATSSKPPPTGCWCCGDRTVAASLLRLSEHQEVGVCFRCVDTLAKRKRTIERMTRHAPPGTWWQRFRVPRRVQSLLISRRLMTCAPMRGRRRQAHLFSEGVVFDAR